MSFTQKHLPDLTGQKPGALIHLGAGRCRELETWIRAGFREIVLVEPDQARAAELRSRAAGHDQVRVVESAVSAVDGESEFNVLSYPDASSLRKPEGLLDLFPGIRIHKCIQTHVIGIDTLLDEVNLTIDGVNGLLIDTPGEEHVIIEALLHTDAVDSLSFIALQASTIPLYAEARPFSSIELLLQDAGFTLERGHEGDEDPIRPIRRFERDLVALECRRLNEQLAEAEKDREALQDKLKQVEAESASAQKRFQEYERKISDLQAERTTLKSQIDALKGDLGEVVVEVDQLKRVKEENEALRKEQVELKSKAAELKKVWEERSQLNQKIEETEAKAADASTRAGRLEKKLDEARSENRRLLDQLTSQAAVSEEIKRLFSEQAESLHQAVKLQKETSEALQGKFLDTILSRVDNSARQVESYIQLNSFFERGELLPDLHGWPISPDLAVYLMRTIKQGDYDLIIEFGSGSSTVLMAQAIAQKLLGRPMKDIQGRVSEVLLEGPQVYRDSENTSQAISQSFGRPPVNGSDLAPRLIAFEHMREYFDKTRSALENAGVTELVELAYTPLQDYQHMDGERYLYYQCDSHLQSLSSRLAAEQPRLLVLVDGPPGSTGQKARFPAAPIVLSYFNSASVDFILDDSNRVDEREILKSWQLEAEKRGYKVEISMLPFEKGAAFFSIT